MCLCALKLGAKQAEWLHTGTLTEVWRWGLTVTEIPSMIGPQVILSGESQEDVGVIFSGEGRCVTEAMLNWLKLYYGYQPIPDTPILLLKGDGNATT